MNDVLATLRQASAFDESDGQWAKETRLKGPLPPRIVEAVGGVEGVFVEAQKFPKRK